MPLHNVALRRREKQGFFTLVGDSEAPRLEWLSAAAIDTANGDLFGPFGDRSSAKKWLMYAAREHRLCDHQLGFSRPRTVGEPCFARQVGRCHGVCEGVESGTRYSERLLAALEPMRFPVWPYEADVVLEERDVANDRTDLLAFDRWCAMSGGVRLPFDGDVFRLLRRTISKAGHTFRPLA